MNSRIFNKPELKSRRKKLRSDMTRAEIILWSHLRRRNLLDFKFRRQYSVQSYVIDFYSPDLELAIEIDGDTHITEAEKEYDSVRQKQITNLGIQFLRFTNAEIYYNIDKVLETIKDKIQRLTLLTPSASPLSNGES